jgi:DNA mismatch endonuclease, patch repair protein
MADVHTKKQRSFNMSRIKGRNTKPEILLRKLLWREGYRYSLRGADIPGKPDLIFRKRKIVIFIDGCFWHRCPQHFQQPSNNADFWRKKIDSNVMRDRKVDKQLQADGWKVLRFWEHDLTKNPTSVVAIVKRAFTSQ